MFICYEGTFQIIIKIDDEKDDSRRAAMSSIYDVQIKTFPQRRRQKHNWVTEPETFFLYLCSKHFPNNN